MRCRFTHKWVVGGVFDAKFLSPWRVCSRCGRIQRGTFDKHRKKINWETMRERNRITSEQIRIVREHSSALAQLAHSLGVRRTRMSDSTKSRKRRPTGVG
jgi:hypothetical protein